MLKTEIRSTDVVFVHRVATSPHESLNPFSYTNLQEFEVACWEWFDNVAEEIQDLKKQIASLKLKQTAKEGDANKDEQKTVEPDSLQHAAICAGIEAERERLKAALRDILKTGKLNPNWIGTLLFWQLLKGYDSTTAYNNAEEEYHS